jgi:hypothetical protein
MHVANTIYLFDRLPPTYMIEMGKSAHQFFDQKLDDHGQKHYHLKPMEQYAMEQDKQEQPSKRYFKASSLAELITTYPMARKDSMSPKELEKGTYSDRHSLRDRIFTHLFTFISCNRSTNPVRFYRFSTGSIEHEPFRTMVTTASETASLYHRRTLHQPFRTINCTTISIQFTNYCTTTATVSRSVDPAQHRNACGH